MNVSVLSAVVAALLAAVVGAVLGLLYSLDMAWASSYGWPQAPDQPGFLGLIPGLTPALLSFVIPSLSLDHLAELFGLDRTGEWLAAGACAFAICVVSLFGTWLLAGTLTAPAYIILLVGLLCLALGTSFGCSSDKDIV